MTTHERSGLSKSSLIVGRVNDAANSEGQATTSTCSVGSGLARGTAAVSDRVRTVPHHVHVRVKRTTCNEVRIFFFFFHHTSKGKINKEEAKLVCAITCKPMLNDARRYMSTNLGRGS